MTQNILIIGANGGIARALIDQICAAPQTQVYTVSRHEYANKHTNQLHTELDSSDELQVQAFVRNLLDQNIRLDHVICTTGVLHTSGNVQLKPEKRLEDINAPQLAEYFRVNTIVPALWMKLLVKVLNKEKASVVFFSARVGSISENEIGGWYGYRASKAALNMLVKTASVEYKRRLPNVSLACYHPGTVDTELSKPFQSNVKPGKLFTADFTATQLLKHIATLEAEKSPYYFDWDGQTIAY